MKSYKKYKGFDIEFVKGDPIYDPECDHKICIGKHPDYYRISNFKKFRHKLVIANTLEDAKLKIKTGYVEAVLSKKLIKDCEQDLKRARAHKAGLEEKLIASRKEIKKLEKKIEKLEK